MKSYDAREEMSGSRSSTVVLIGRGAVYLLDCCLDLVIVVLAGSARLNPNKLSKYLPTSVVGIRPPASGSETAVWTTSRTHYVCVRPSRCRNAKMPNATTTKPTSQGSGHWGKPTRGKGQRRARRHFRRSAVAETWKC